ncbi:thiamine biosynthesis protein ThiS [Pedobacter sp. Leaf216]|uniref:sulfur carrier protein ThiS n=1 Tax=Pedobacter sp. Leaf216 TaxID=1735684 RepID=UPI0006F7675A|nr:sulfur carrier protein ThiS [Pedobacter sp. Leaf216]KQM79210.1 thiamine biosynthesis protein ThiS [Pedobacter sp. Leaf216]
MEVTINNQNHSLKETCSIEQLFATVLLLETDGLAIAVNQNIIPKSGWAGHLLSHGDQIILIKATQGG